MSLSINAILGPEIGATVGRDKGFSLTGALMPPSPANARIAVGIVLDAVADLHEALTRPPTEAEKREAQQRERDKAEQARQDQVKKDQERVAQEVLERLGPNGANLFRGIRGLSLEDRLIAIKRLMVGITTISLAEQSARADGVRPANGFEPSEEMTLADADLKTAKHRPAHKPKIIGTIVLNDLGNSPGADDRREMTGESVSLVGGDAKLALPLGGDQAPRITISGPIALDKSVRLKNRSGQLTASAQDDEIYGHADVTLEYADGRSTSFTGMRLKFSKDSVFRGVENPGNLSNAA